MTAIAAARGQVKHMSDDFSLVPFEPSPPRAPGRPLGLLNKRTQENYRRAEEVWPAILNGILRHAARLNDPWHKPTRIEMQCVLLVASRMWPEPRGTPILNVDISQGGNLLAAVQEGEITPGDAATLIRAYGSSPSCLAPIPQDDPRQLIAEKLSGLIESRKARERHA